MKKERKRLNKKIVAFILALSMILGQTSVLFATESGNAAVPEAPAVGEAVSPVEGQTEPSLTGDAQTPEKTETAEGADPASREVKAPEAQTEGTEDAAEAEKKQEAVSDDATEASEVSEDKAQAPAAAETEVEENAGASGNKISLSGGSISVNIPTQSGNQTYYYSASENLYYVSGCTVSEAKLSGKKTGMKIGFEFTVVSDNASVNTVLKVNDDYKVSWNFAPTVDESGNAVSGAPKPVSGPDYIPTQEGFIIVSINATSEKYENSINIKIKVEKKHEEEPEKKLVSGDLIANVSGNVITVSNNSSDKFMFFDLVKADALSVNQQLEPSILIPGESVQMIAFYRENGVKKIVTESMNIAVVASTDYSFNSGNSQQHKVLSIDPSKKTDIHDGYSEINMKAYVDRNSQLMKISWAPKSDLKFKTYELLRMNESGDFELIPEWKDSKGNTKLSKKNFAYKYNKNAAKDKDGIERAAKPAIFLLKCYDADGKMTEYLTVAAPSLLYVEPSYKENTMEYCFSELYSTVGLSYKLELAEKKKEKTGEDAEGKRGFAETEKYAAEIFSEDAYDIENYLVKKGISVNAIVGDFNGNDSLKLKIGTQYFCRVKTKYYYKGKEFSSAPSNVLSRKAGPTKSFVFDVNGVRYEKPAGANKSTIEQQNAERMRRHISAWIEDQTVSADIYTHMNNQGPDAKSGYVVFLTEKNKDNSIKGFELLRSETQYGTYKKIKAYNLDAQGNPAKNSGLAKFNGTYALLEHYDIYYMWFNNFPPEKNFYYAVRAVSRTGGAQGGFGDGYECRAELDKVSKLYALDGKINKINLYWKHDDCVKKYKIFRRDKLVGNSEEFNPTDGSWKPIALVNGGKSGTLKESDKNLTKGEKKDLYEATSGNLVGDYNKFIDKRDVRTGHVYDYAIVPIYDVKNKDSKYNIDKVSDIVPGVATLEGVKIKNFKASNGGVHKINTSWSKIIKDQDIEYMVIRTTEPPANPEDAGDWLRLWLNKNGELYDKTIPIGDPRPLVYITKERTFKDERAKVGQTYYYAIFAGDFPDKPTQETVASLSDVVYKSAKSMPLAAANIQISEGGNIRNGANITFTKNPADKDEWSNITYVLEGNVNGVWKEIVSSTNDKGTVGAWDGNELRRGVERKYRVIAYYDGYKSGARESGVYSKPNKVEWNGNTNIMVGEETKISVYAKCGGSTAFVNEINRSTKGNIQVTSEKKEGDHYVFTVKGTGVGTGTLTVSAKGWNDYTDGSSKDDLRKHITINVRSISPIIK